MATTTTSPDAKRASRGPKHFIGRIPTRWRFYLAIAVAVPMLALSALLGYWYVEFSKMIEDRVHAERVRVVPRVFTRPFELHAGQGISERQLVERLNDLGYANRPHPADPGQFAIGKDTLVLVPREGAQASKQIRIQFSGTADAGSIRQIQTVPETMGRRVPPPATLDTVTLESPLITALATSREKQRIVPLSRIPKHQVEAVLAIEDHRFYDHPGVDLIGFARAAFTNLFGNKPYLAGGSTITQQLVKNMFNMPEKTIRRKLKEQYMALIIERRLSKDEILELYLNDVYLGNRGSFEIHGVAEAARLFFGKDVSNVTLGEAATIAGVIQTARHSPFKSIERARERRNV
ncbi:MAG TPA: transglycosylase domain-containing protein, partial [Gemmatimonadaceae bacterium]|nr:transglycosylase domain-containing protein [Gemmatimonadaceae bacterium]